MLRLSRKVGESVRIGDVEVYVAGIRKGRVQLSIEAPRQVEIVRSEIDGRPPVAEASCEEHPLDVDFRE